MEHRLVRWIVRLGFAAVVTLVLTQFKLDPLEFMLYDWRAGLIRPPAASGEVVLIGIDNATLDQLKRTPTAPDLTVALKNLKTAEPSALVTLVRPTEFIGSIEDVAVLADFARQINLVYGEADLPAPGAKNLPPLPPP